MALTIQTEKGIFDLPRDFSVEIENTSPIYTDKGSQTIASTLPATGHNLSMVDYIHRPDIRNAPKRDAAAVVTDGVYRRTGKLNITSVSTESGIVCNIGFMKPGKTFHSRNFRDCRSSNTRKASQPLPVTWRK